MNLTLVPRDATTRAQHPRRWRILLVLCASPRSSSNSTTPSSTSSQLQWIVDFYAMVFARLLLVVGAWRMHFGAMVLPLFGLTIFAAESCGAALSGTVDMLIAFKAVIGAGAALTIPSSLSIVNDVIRDPKDRARAIGAWGGTIGLGIALAIAPSAGGSLLARLRSAPAFRPVSHRLSRRSHRR